MNSNFKKAIKIIHERLESNNIKWALVGSMNMQLQGMNVQPRDLDVIIQLKDLEKMREIFSEYNPSLIKELKPFVDEPVWDVIIKIGDVEIQLFAERDTGPYVKKIISWKIN